MEWATLTCSLFQISSPTHVSNHFAIKSKSTLSVLKRNWWNGFSFSKLNQWHTLLVAEVAASKIQQKQINRRSIPTCLSWLKSMVEPPCKSCLRGAYVEAIQWSQSLLLTIIRSKIWKHKRSNWLKKKSITWHQHLTSTDYCSNTHRTCSLTFSFDILSI